jgi:hypothetical protein
VDATEQYFDAVFGDAEGYAHLAVGAGPLVTARGKYGYESFAALGPYEWPHDAQLVAHEVRRLTRMGQVDVFACPNILRGRERKRGTAVSRTLLHSDVDGDGAVGKLRALQGFGVASGRPGHTHAYVPLDRELTLSEYGLLERALREYLNADNKIADNDLLRPVGTLNHKATVIDGLEAPYEVTWLIEPNGARVSPELVADVLGVNLNMVEAERDGAPESAAATPLEAFDLEQYPDLKCSIAKRLGDRSADTQRIVSAGFRAGLQLAQIRWAVAQRPDLQERLDERPDDDVARIYCALADERQAHHNSTITASDPAADFEAKVDRELVLMRVRNEAKRRFSCETTTGGMDFDLGLLGDVLARADRPTYRIDRIIPSNSAAFVVAQRKVGKTTLVLNLARSLITGEPFLGVFMPEPLSGRVAFLNYEVSGAQLAAWAEQIGVPVDRMLLVNLRGSRDPLGHADDRARLADALREHRAEALIVDPFGRAFGGASQNDAGDVGRWLVDLDRFARSEAGVSDLILTTHAGWYGDRARGSSALEDWADSIILLTKAEGSASEDRYLKAIGRDVSVDEDRLAFDPVSRLLTMTGSGGRKEVRQASKAEELLDYVLRCLSVQSGVSQTQVLGEVRKVCKDKAISFQDNDVREACKLGEKRGLVRRESLGSGKPTLHYLIDSSSCTAVDAPAPAREESTSCR